MDARGSPTASSWHTVLSSSASQTDGVLRDAVHFYQKSSSTTDDFDIPLMGYRLPQASPGNTNNKGDAQNILRSFNDLRRAWKWEIFTLLVGMYALCDIIVLLALYRNQPTSEWKLKLELGTAIAVLSQVAHSAFLVPVAACIGQLKWNWLQDRASKTGQAATAIDIRRFDEATRGPWGSLLLLLKIRQLHLAAFGAAITLLMLSFSAFAQQAVVIELRQVVDPDLLAVVSNSVQFRESDDLGNIVDNSTRFQRLDLPQEMGESTFDLRIAASLYSGMLMTSANRSHSPGSCPTEYCTWENYTSLALCSFTEDISPTIFRDQNVPDYPVFLVPELDEVPASVEKSIPTNMWMTTLVKSSSQTGEVVLPPVAEVYILYSSLCHETTSMEEWLKVSGDARSWKALKGTFEFCLKTQNSIYNYSMETTISNTQTKLRWTSEDGRYYTSNDPAQTYSISRTSSMLLSEKLQHVFNGSLSRTSSGLRYSGQWTPNVASDLMEGGLPVKQCRENDYATFDAFTRRLDLVSVSISQSMRDGSGGVRMEGSVWKTEQYIKVQFLWLLPLIVQCASTALLLILTIARSRSKTVPLWKSSALVLLHCMDHNNGMQALSAVEKNAESTVLELIFGSNRWYLKERQQT